MKISRSFIAYLQQSKWFAGLATMAVVLSSVSIAFAAPLYPPPNEPFTCENTFYQDVQMATNTSQLYKMNPADGSYTAVGLTYTDAHYNAMGYNPQDNFMYATTDTGLTKRLVRIYSNGVVEDVHGGTINGVDPFSTEGFKAGDVDDDNGLWVVEFSTRNRLYRIDLTSPTNQATTLNLSGANSGNIWVADLVYQDGYLYGVGGASGNNPRYLYQINADTGVVEGRIALSDQTSTAITGGDWGAGWVTSDNHLYFLRNNTGEIYEVLNYKTAAPSMKLVVTGTSAANNDGASCRLAKTTFGPGATADDFTTAPLPPTGGTAGNVLTNDTYNGVSPVNPAQVTVTVPEDNGTSITVAPNGDVTVPNGLPGGNHTITYQICSIDDPANCDTADVVVAVQTPANPIVATNDTYAAVNGHTGAASLGSVLGNDTLSGSAVSQSAVTLTTTSSVPAGLTFNTTTGVVGVQAGTATGNYSFTYQICEAIVPTNCDTATATVTVTEPPVNAINDTYASVNGNTGNPNVGTILGNDTINGSVVNPANITTTTTSPLPTGVTINTSTGVVSVAAGTAPGSHTITYQICDTAHPTNCDSAAVSLTIVDTPGMIVATNDSFTPLVSGTAGNVLGNDTLNGNPAAGGTTDISVTNNGGLTGVAIADNGNLTVPTNTPAGTYTITYQLCETAHPANCDTATATVTVLARPIVATDNSYGSVNGHVGASNLGTVLANDTLGGTSFAPSAVTTTLIGTLPTGITFTTATGVVGVQAGTATGTYTFDYRICENLNPTNCDTATVSVAVTMPPIVANNDSYSPVTSSIGNPAVGNIFTNDTKNGSTATPADITATLTGTPPAGITINTTTGAVSVAPGAATGNHTIGYQICDATHPTNCDSATITIPVVNPPGVIVANNDSFTPLVSGTAGNVLGNDTLNGNPAAGGTTDISVTNNGGLTGVAIADNGNLTVPTNTPAGTYTITYQLCETAHPANCDTATIAITVLVPAITTTDDTYTHHDGDTGDSNIGNVLDNDTLGGTRPATSAVTFTTLGYVPAELTVDQTTGVVGIVAGTPTGNYSFIYRICEVVNPINCDSATVFVVVTNTVTPHQDAITAGPDGGIIGNIFANDRIGNMPVAPNRVTISLISTGGIDSLAINPNGDIVVPAGVEPGNYTARYQLCLISEPTVCEQANILIGVQTTTPPTMTNPSHPGKTPGADTSTDLRAPDTGFATRVTGPLALIVATLLLIVGGYAAYRYRTQA